MRGAVFLRVLTFLINCGLGTASTQHPAFRGLCAKVLRWTRVLLRVTQASAILPPPLLPPAPAAASLPAPLHSCLLSFPSQSHLKGILIVSPEDAGRHSQGAEKTLEFNGVKVASCSLCGAYSTNWEGRGRGLQEKSKKQAVSVSSSSDLGGLPAAWCRARASLAHPAGRSSSRTPWLSPPGSSLKLPVFIILTTIYVITALDTPNRKNTPDAERENQPRVFKLSVLSRIRFGVTNCCKPEARGATPLSCSRGLPKQSSPPGYDKGSGSNPWPRCSGSPAAAPRGAGTHTGPWGRGTGGRGCRPLVPTTAAP